MLIELLILGIVAVMAFIAGKTWGQYQLIKQMMDCLTPSELESVRQAVIEERSADSDETRVETISSLIKATVVPLKKETIDSRLFLYRSDDGSFVCQGDTLKDAASTFHDMFPQRVGRIEGDGDVVYIIGGVLTSDNKS